MNSANPITVVSLNRINIWQYYTIVARPNALSTYLISNHVSALSVFPGTYGPYYVNKGLSIQYNGNLIHPVYLSTLYFLPNSCVYSSYARQSLRVVLPYIRIKY